MDTQFWYVCEKSYTITVHTYVKTGMLLCKTNDRQVQK